MERIDAELLIPGRGEPVRDAAVVIDGATISYAGPAAGAPAAAGVTARRAATVLPGLWDCHGHFMGSRSLDLARLAQEPVGGAGRPLRARPGQRAAARGSRRCARSAGSASTWPGWCARGLLDGPAIYAAGAVLSTTGGHGDLHCYPLAWVEDFSRSDGELRLADGIAECMRAVREQLRQGAAVIKVCASGGVLSEVDHPIHQQFTGRRAARDRGGGRAGRPRGGGALPRQAGDHGRAGGGRGHHRARHLPGRGGVRRDAGDRGDPGADPQHRRVDPGRPGPGAALRGGQADRDRPDPRRGDDAGHRARGHGRPWAPTSA